jgi:hypothetical protein
VIGWAIAAVAMPAALALSIFARRGRGPRARRVALLRYRQPDLPAVIRNAWIVMPVLAGGFIPLLVVTAPATLGIALPQFPMGLQQLLVLGSLAYAFLLFGTVPVLLYRPPRRLVPGWIVEDDRRTGYAPPKPGLLDRAFLLLGLAFLALGVAVLAVLVAAEVL